MVLVARIKSLFLVSILSYDLFKIIFITTVAVYRFDQYS